MRIEASKGKLLESKKSIRPLNIKVLKPSSEIDVNSSSYHSYYNTDFGSNSKRTDVWHRVNIRGYNDGYAYVTTEKGKSGEGSSLLSFKLQTY